MTGERQNRPRYRAKAARRPTLFWWQAFMLLGLAVLLWSRLPLTAVLYAPRTVPRLPEPRAAYVALDPAYAADVFKRSLSAWSLGQNGGSRAAGMELGGIELGEPARPPEYLEQGLHYPGVWQPLAVSPLPLPVPEVRAPSAAAPALRPPVGIAPGVRLSVSPELLAAGFVFPHEADLPPERGGRCRFYVETQADGSVAHVLLLTPKTLGASVYERLVLRGRAAGAARGFVELDWLLPKP